MTEYEYRVFTSSWGPWCNVTDQLTDNLMGPDGVARFARRIQFREKLAPCGYRTIQCHNCGTQVPHPV